jgi:hypothetical protein
MIFTTLADGPHLEIHAEDCVREASLLPPVYQQLCTLGMRRNSPCGLLLFRLECYTRPHAQPNRRQPLEGVCP